MGGWRVYEAFEMDPVLRASVEAFNETGYHGATVRDIARRSGLSVPGMYHHFATKQDMLVGILDYGMNDLLDRSRQARDEGQGDPVRTFSLLVECLVLFHCHRRDLAFIGASEMRSLEPSNRARIASMRTAQQRLLDAEVDQAHRAGRFKVSFPHDASRAVATMCTAIPSWYRIDHERTPEEVAERYVEFALGLMHYDGPRPV
jgi:AcrR family transcriptional regulator